MSRDTDFLYEGEDYYNDEVEVEAIEEVEDGVVVRLFEGSRSVTHIYEGDGARKLAVAILAAAGRAPTSSGQTHAGELTLNEGLLRLAAVHKVAVNFYYLKEDTNEGEYRSFEPTRFTSVPSGAHLVAGFDRRRNQFRSFRLDRIEGLVELTEMPFVGPHTEEEEAPRSDAKAEPITTANISPQPSFSSLCGDIP